jgi:ankyrin repeat protein
MSELAEQFKAALTRGDTVAVRAALAKDAGLANATIRWHLNQDNESDPLHYVCDCVAHGWLDNGAEGELAEQLLASGALIDGSKGRESPLIAAASMSVARVAKVLIRAGANLEVVALFGARALHWASWVGAAGIVDALLSGGAEVEVRCTEFGATPLFWAVHGYGPRGPKEKREQVEAARLLLAAGATVATANREGLTALALARQGKTRDMAALLQGAAGSAE